MSLSFCGEVGRIRTYEACGSARYPTPGLDLDYGSWRHFHIVSPISGNLQPTLSTCIPPSYFMVIPHSSIKRHSTTVRIHRRSLILSFRCLYLSIWNMGILWKGVSYSHSALRYMHANLLCQHCLHRLMLYPRLCHKGRALPGDSEELRYPDLWRDRPALCLWATEPYYIRIVCSCDVCIISQDFPFVNRMHEKSVIYFILHQLSRFSRLDNARLWPFYLNPLIGGKLHVIAILFIVLLLPCRIWSPH